jgi:dTDP-4-amino-4,6-dideoxy-D-galactose acyltransferase
LCAAGFDLIEVRAWYHRSLVDFEPKERFNVRQAKVEDIPRLAQTAVNRKNPYDRFHADPILADELVNRLMETWVENSIAGDFADLVMVPNSENPAAFCTARKRQDLWEPLNLKVSQTVLSAVDKSFRGWYPKIFSEVCCRLKEMGAEHIFAKTQTTNTSVIKTWERISLKYAKTELVFRYSDVAQ